MWCSTRSLTGLILLISLATVGLCRRKQSALHLFRQAGVSISLTQRERAAALSGNDRASCDHFFSSDKCHPPDTRHALAGGTLPVLFVADFMR